MRIFSIIVLSALFQFGFSHAQQATGAGEVSPISELINSGEEIPVPPVTVPPLASPPVDSPKVENPATHTIRAGDNPWTIAKEYGVSIQELLSLNEIKDEKTLQIGQVLKLPPKSAIELQPAVPAPSTLGFDPGDYEVYTIKKGDNPWTIARQLKVNEQALLDLNQISDPLTLKIGQKLKIPKKGEMVASGVTPPANPETEAAAEPVFDEEGYQIYVIRSGDNPWTIARKFQFGHKELLDLNQIADPKDLKIGQKLRLPKKE